MTNFIHIAKSIKPTHTIDVIKRIDKEAQAKADRAIEILSSMLYKRKPTEHDMEKIKQAIKILKGEYV